MSSRIKEFSIRREGHPITGQSDTLLTIPKLEMTEGKLFNSDEDRLYVLSLLLESVGTDAAVRIGSRTVWRDSIAESHND